MRIRFERFENMVELLPSIYYHKQRYRSQFGKGVIVIGWLKWGIVFYVKRKES